MSLSVKISSAEYQEQPVALHSAAAAPAVIIRPTSGRRSGRFGYDAARNDRLNADWRPMSVGPNRDLRTAIETVRNRARDLVANDDYAKGYIRQLKSNVIGPYGFNPKIKPKEKNEKFRSNALKLQDLFYEWSEKENCSFTGDQSFVDIQNMVITYAGRDGEYAIREIRSKNLPFGYALQFLQIELLDENYNEILSKDRVVVLGVEYDRHTYRKTAYYFRDIPLEAQVHGFITTVGTRQRIPAEEIIHDFDHEFVNQSRGISWLVQTMSSMRMLSKYEEAMLVAARMRATFGGFLKTDKEAPGTYEGDSEDSDGNLVMELENGIWKQLPRGVSAEFPNNDFPSAVYPDFVQKNLQKQATGLGVAASVHSGNYSDVNFSSERARQIAVRENWMMTQQWLIRGLLNRVWKSFVNEAVFVGKISVPFADLPKYKRAVWGGKRWPYVNPEQEMNANMMKWSLKMKSVSQMIEESDDNLDPEEVFQQIEDDIKRAEKHGFRIETDIKQPTVPPENPPPAPPKPEKKEK